MDLRDLECQSPCWSPDGEWIAFTGRLADRSRIYLIAPDGSGLRTLTAEDAPQTDPAWARGRKLVALAAEQPGGWQLCTVGLDGAAPTEVTAGRQPAWAPDGKRLAFVREIGSKPQVHVVALGGSEVVCLTREGNNTCPAWSPDGKQIALVGGRAGTQRLFGMSPDGSGQVMLADVAASEPSWSPDGTTLAYAGTTEPRSARGPLPVGICLLSLADRSVRLLRSAVMGGSPDWSPDGGRIVFTRNFRLYVVEVGSDTAAPVGG